MLKQNIGQLDGTIRVIAGLALVSLALLKGYVWGWIGVLLVVSAFLGSCPVYSLLGVSTCPAPKSDKLPPQETKQD